MNFYRLLLRGIIKWKKFFIPYWISCLYESMLIWMNKSTCPGFLFCPRKSHIDGNKYSVIYCNESGIMYGWEIWGGRDRTIPIERLKFKTNANIKMVRFMLQITKVLCSTGKTVTMDSGFCVLKGLL